MKKLLKYSSSNQHGQIDYADEKYHCSLCCGCFHRFCAIFLLFMDHSLIHLVYIFFAHFVLMKHDTWLFSDTEIACSWRNQVVWTSCCVVFVYVAVFLHGRFCEQHLRMLAGVPAHSLVETAGSLHNRELMNMYPYTHAHNPHENGVDAWQNVISHVDPFSVKRTSFQYTCTVVSENNHPNFLT